MQKCIKLKIIKPFEENVSWAEFGKVLNDLSYAVYNMSNQVMTEKYINVILNKKEKDEPVSLYLRLTEKFPDVAGHIVGQAERQAKKKWNTFAKDVLKGNSSLPTFKRTSPVFLHNKGYNIEKQDNSYIIDAQLLSKRKDKTRYQFIIAAPVRDKSAMACLEKIVIGEYKKGDAQIVKKDKDWFIVIPYSFEVNPTYYDISKDNIMGIDLGITKVAYWAFNNSLKRGCIDGGEIEKFRATIQSRRKTIQRQYPYSGRKGHGVNRCLLPTDSLREKEANFRNTCNFRYAHYIVMQALKNHCGVIQMENLEGISAKTTSKFLKNWTYYDLKTKIVNKAKEYGIEVVFINPQYTSQRCSACGHIHKENRPSQSTFICQECGYGTEFHVNADFNAARNISTPQIEEIINSKLIELGIVSKHLKKSSKVS